VKIKKELNFIKKYRHMGIEMMNNSKRDYETKYVRRGMK
jgi:hypothetical protein